MRSNANNSLEKRSFWKKAGRKIHVGDCALFKLTDGSPPFVGIIRRLIVGKEENLSLSVNWFYRPADVKLGEGALLGAAPNEVFYSFHKDEIPAASLLHPCKVAFLRKGVELPSGISSFVCRRVYDVEKKCLWWLTDQNYINQRQEIEQLLDKTQAEMHGSAQRGGSPKPLGASNGTTPSNTDSDNIQNNSISSPVKSKKREHGIYSPDSMKRECLSNRDEADAGQDKPEHVLKSEIAKFTDKGGLVNFEGVEKLIRLMQPESAEKKVDLSSRVILVDVISVTDRFDCLSRFVHHKGLLILDEWLQEVHKGKIGDGSPKGSDKSVEEFLFALFRALDRLPVNLHALQTCNIGKSVNHLRSHKNSEIQKKARSLVDLWKKRVEAEMNIIETRSGTRRGGSWTNKSVMSDVSPMGSPRVSGSSDADAKVSTAQSLKSQLGKPSSGETTAKSPKSPASVKHETPASAGTGSSDMPLVTNRGEKSSSSSPSANNGQSCSSEHGKTKASCREDAPNSTSGPVSMNKTSSGNSNNRKSGNVVHESAVPSGQKEGALGKIGPVNQNFSSGQGSPNRASTERVPVGSSVDNINHQRLILKLPSTGCSLALHARNGSFEDASTTFGKSPLVHPENQDRRGRDKLEATQKNNVVAMEMDLCQGKEELVGSDEVKKGTAGVPSDEHSGDGEIVEKLTDASNVNCSAPDATFKQGKSYDISYSSVNALVESCAKFSEDNGSASAGDDVGLNLLASVVAGEMSRSDASMVCSPESKPPLTEETCSGNNAKLRQSFEDRCQSEEDVKPTSVSNRRVLVPASYISVDSKGTSSCNEKVGEGNAKLGSCVTGLPQNCQDALMAPDATNGSKEGNERDPHLKSNRRSPSVESKNVGCAFEKTMENNVVLSDATAARVKVETHINDGSTSWSSSEKHKDEKKFVGSSNLVLKMEAGKDTELGSCVGLGAKGAKGEEADVTETENRAAQCEKPNIESDSSVMLHGSENAKDNNEVDGSGGSTPLQDGKSCLKHSDAAEEGSSDEPSSTSAPVSEMVVKWDFDLNEVLPSDGGPDTDQFSAVHTPYSLQSVLTGSQPNVVAVAAEGTFCPPESIVSGKATSVAESRKVIDMAITKSDAPVPDNCSSKHARPLLDLDLNVEVIEDASTSGGLGLDLNACEESPDVGFGTIPQRLLSGGRYSNPSTGFDLNSGPGFQEIGGESMQFLSAVPSLRTNNMGMGNWIPATSTNPIPGAAASQRVSTPAAAIPSIMSFQFPGFPFESNFSAASTSYIGAPLSFPTIPSTASYRPLTTSLAGGSNDAVRRWGAMGGEQLKLFQQMAAGGGGGGLLKRKEPEDGRDADRISYKHPSWR